MEREQFEVLTLEKLDKIIALVDSHRGYETNGDVEKAKKEIEDSESIAEQVICNDCNKQTTVPFKPKKNWPVYCMDCYKKRRGSQ